MNISIKPNLQLFHFSRFGPSLGILFISILFTPMLTKTHMDQKKMILILFSVIYETKINRIILLNLLLSQGQKLNKSTSKSHAGA
jgi:hypothetical protein